MSLSEDYRDKCNQRWSYFHIYKRHIITLVVYYLNHSRRLAGPDTLYLNFKIYFLEHIRRKSCKFISITTVFVTWFRDIAKEISLTTYKPVFLRVYSEGNLANSHPSPPISWHCERDQPNKPAWSPAYWTSGNKIKKWFSLHKSWKKLTNVRKVV